MLDNPEICVMIPLWSGNSPDRNEGMTTMNAQPLPGFLQKGTPKVVDLRKHREDRFRACLPALKAEEVREFQMSLRDIFVGSVDAAKKGRL